ncbi:MAG TPA: hypothetical protein VGQ96_04555 [Candidatus Eremiobacteraceae bacterium]|nr:hypothetical protein [Candidatus Eremiobacteraceae bacterium]
MRISAFVLACLLIANPLVVISPGLAQPHAIDKLGDYPLLGALSSRVQLLAAARSHPRRFAIAAGQLGLSQQEFHALKAGLPSARYVVIPRHLDAMSWYSGGTYVTNDMLIPAGTRGWEVDIPQGEHLLQVFIPASCGNLSILRQMMPRVAQKSRVPYGVMAYQVRAPLTKSATRPIAAPIPATAGLPAPTPAALTTTTTPSAAERPQTPEVAGIHPPPATGHHRFPWFVLPLILPLFFIGGGGGGDHHTGSPPIVAPIPTPTCPGRPK